MADRAFARAALESYLRACEEHDERGTDGYLYAGALLDEMKGHARSKDRIAELEAEVERLRGVRQDDADMMVKDRATIRRLRQIAKDAIDSIPVSQIVTRKRLRAALGEGE